MLIVYQPYVTEMDLRHSLIPDELIEDLLHTMPKHNGPDLEVDRHLPKYDYISFMESMMGNDKQETTGAANGLSKGNKPLQGNGAR
jgi:hypothetical protein